MKWHEITVELAEEAQEFASYFLQELGTKGVSIEETGVYRPDHVDMSYGVLFDTGVPLNDIPVGRAVVKGYLSFVGVSAEQVEERLTTLRAELAKLPSYGMEDAQAVVTAAVVDDEDWANNWKAYFKPFRVTSRLTIKPTWETYERTDGAEQIIELDPAMAFGTGAHPTTSLSLGLLQDVIQGGEDLIDVGTGSGILAIGALKLGAGHVLALDLDPLAVKAATENAALNGYDQEQIDVRLSDLLGVLQETERAQGEADVPPLHVQLPVDIVVANILAEIIISFVDDVYQALRIGGKYIVSGVIDSRREVVLDALTAGGFTIDEVRTSGDWIAILAHK